MFDAMKILRGASLAQAVPAEEEAVLEAAPAPQTKWKSVGPQSVSGYSDERGRYYVSGLNDDRMLNIPPIDVKNYAIWCPYEGDPKETLDLLKTILQDDIKERIDEVSGNAKENSSGESKPEGKSDFLFAQILLKALQFTNNAKYTWCKVSTAQSSTPWYPESSQLEAPAMTLLKGFWDSVALGSPLSLPETTMFCERHNAWLTTVQRVVPQTVESIILRKWEEQDGREQSEEDKKEFFSALDKCRKSMDILYDPDTNRYDVSQDPKSLCIEALKMVLPKDKAASAEGTEQASGGGWPFYYLNQVEKKDGPVEALSQLMDIYLLKMPWTTWIQRYSFCDDLVNTNIAWKIARNWGLKMFAWMYGAVATVVLGLSRYAGSNVLLGVLLPTKWPGVIKEAYQKFKERRQENARMKDTAKVAAETKLDPAKGTRVTEYVVDRADVETWCRRNIKGFNTLIADEQARTVTGVLRELKEMLDEGGGKVIKGGKIKMAAMRDAAIRASSPRISGKDVLRPEDVARDGRAETGRPVEDPAGGRGKNGADKMRGKPPPELAP